MTLFFAEGSATTNLSTEQMREALTGVYNQLGPRERVMLVPPDYTRLNSRAGELTCMSHAYFGGVSSVVSTVSGTGMEARRMRCAICSFAAARSMEQTDAVADVPPRIRRTVLMTIFATIGKDRWSMT